jgi:hypothetical protein
MISQYTSADVTSEFFTKTSSVVYVISIKRRFHARERTRVINHHRGRSFDAVKKKKLFYESSNSKKGGGFEEEEQEASVRVR